MKKMLDTNCFASSSSSRVPLIGPLRRLQQTSISPLLARWHGFRPAPKKRSTPIAQRPLLASDTVISLPVSPRQRRG